MQRETGTEVRVSTNLLGVLTSIYKLVSTFMTDWMNQFMTDWISFSDPLIQQSCRFLYWGGAEEVLKVGQSQMGTCVTICKIVFSKLSPAEDLE